jgi:hypothetical protein
MHAEDPVIKRYIEVNGTVVKECLNVLARQRRSDSSMLVARRDLHARHQVTFVQQLVQLADMCYALSMLGVHMEAVTVLLHVNGREIGEEELLQMLTLL